MKSNIFAALVSLSLSSLALATEAKIQSFVTSGTGCPLPDDKKIPYGFDGQWLTVELNHAVKINVEKGNGTTPSDTSKNCAITLDLDAPGYRYAVERVVTWGTYLLASNDQFVASSTGFFAGQGDTFSAQSDAYGPTGHQGYHFDRTLGASDLVWSQCYTDRALTLNTAVRLISKGNADRHAAYSKGSLDRVAFRFIFKKC